MGLPPFLLTGDALILDLIKKGDERALAELYMSTRKMVTSHVIRNSGTQDDADDMLQEALVVLWERVRSQRFEYTAKLSTFIFSTVKHLWMHQLSRRRREVRSEFAPENIPMNESSVLDEIISEEESGRVSSAMAKLGETCRTLLLLFYWEELSLEDIAHKMGFANADTVKSKKYQCKETLRGLLAAEGHSHD